MNPIPNKQPIAPDVPAGEAGHDPSRQAQDALDNVREGYDDESADANADLPASASGGPRKKQV